MVKKENLSDSEHDIFVGQKAGLFQKLLMFWDFHSQLFLGFTETSLKTKIH